MIRTHDAGALRAEHVGQTVTLAGWVARRRDHGGVAFLDLREASGVVQVVVRDEAVAHSLRSEYCLKVTGEVALRPEGNANPNLPTGEIEVITTDLEVLSASAPLPFPIDDTASHRGGDVGEEARLKHRYLDLRRTGPNAALRLRSKVNKAARDVLDEHGFVEIETPTLTRSTPEGARDFLVPARLQPGSWYALPQSPQLFKQLLMVAGMERYFQIARCYRDEDFRADRQPEFTQLDIEMSFVEQDDVLAVAEDVLDGAVVAGRVRRPDAAAADDLRRGDGTLRLRQAGPAHGPRARRVHRLLQGHAVPGLLSWQRAVRRCDRHARRRVASRASSSTPGRSGRSSGARAAWPTSWWPTTASSAGRWPRTSATTSAAGLAAHVGASPGDCVFFAAGPVKSSRSLLGAARLEIGRRGGLIDEDAWSFLWVVDAPLFEPADEATAAGEVAVGSGAWTAVHHAFTSPQDVDTFDQDPGHALAWAYDIVCNGNEIGGGSIRIHRDDVQRRVFSVMGLEADEAQEKFGFLLDAFKYGAPPHGGIAFGWDRIVALLARTESIRDVIAFPKSGGGFDPLTAAPAPITPEQRREAGVDARPAAPSAQAHEAVQGAGASSH